MKEPCGNHSDCDKCHPEPRWRVSQERVQRLTYAREIKAATAEEARRIYDEGTSWPSQYDDEYGEVIVEADVEVERLPERGQLMFACYRDLPEPEVNINTSPLPRYAGCEEMSGRLRAFVPGALFSATCDRSNHDGGDESERMR